MSQKVHYVLTWIAHPTRSPVHPKPMTGRQSFKTVMEAYLFFSLRQSYSEFVSLEEVVTTTTDWTLIFKNILEEENGL